MKRAYTQTNEEFNAWIEDVMTQVDLEVAEYRKVIECEPTGKFILCTKCDHFKAVFGVEAEDYVCDECAVEKQINPSTFDVQALTDQELQDDIDTFTHVCRHLGQFHVKDTEKTDAVIDRLAALEIEQRRRMKI